MPIAFKEFEKLTGQGPGLGLSLSYDIIKAHGGEINVETKESVGSTFIIQYTDIILPFGRRGRRMAMK
jgi:signal transduction histidine kinase